MLKYLKSSILVCIVTTCIPLLCAREQVNTEEVEVLSSKYEMLYNKFVKSSSIPDLMSNLEEGDTIHLKSFECNIEYVVPDTIWKKHKKKPKINKHYALQYIWKGEPTSDVNEFGFPVFRQSTKIVDDDFIFSRYDIVQSSGKVQLIVKEISDGRELRFLLEESNVLKLTSEKINRIIGSNIERDTIFFVRGEGEKETDYGFLVFKSAVYSASLNDRQFSGNLNVKTDDESYPVIRGKLELWGKQMIPKEEYISSLQSIRRDKEFLSLAVVRGISSDLDYRFMSDTMAVYKIMKDTVEALGEITCYYCYAYGQSYRFDGDNVVKMLSPNDSSYLLSVREKGENYRLDNAKQWDERNLWLKERDEIWDNDTCIMAIIKGDCHLIDGDGISKGPIADREAKKPKVGSRVPVALYGHDAGNLSTFRIFYKGEYFFVRYENLVFDSQEHCKYLMRRGPQGYRQRTIKVISHDMEETFMENLVAEIKKYENYQKKQIFLLGMDSFDSEYGWDGIEFKIYNCFKKTIKYVYITVTAYNYFGDVQGDSYGRTTKDVRCIGPIEEDEGGTFTFNDMFNNKNGIISSYKPTKIKITFIDNSTISYSTWPKIKPHTDF